MPDWTQASVPIAKLKRYLLSESHETGKSKAAFFRSHGFHADRAEQLGGELKNIAERYPVKNKTSSKYGTKYVIDGIMLTPTNEAVLIRTVWLTKQGSVVPKLITAYPLRLQR